MADWHLKELRASLEMRGWRVAAQFMMAKGGTHAEHRFKNGWWVLRLLCALVVAMGSTPSFVADAQGLAAQWTPLPPLAARWSPLPPASFEKFGYVFAPLDITSHRNDILLLDLAPLKILRIESADFCRDGLCLTIVTTDCGRSACPSTSVFVGREVELEKLVLPFFGGTQFVRFPRSRDRTVTVMYNKAFVSVIRGFGGD
jgi:hypothetical protein